MGLVSSHKQQVTGEEKMASSCAKGVSDWILEKFLHRKGCQALEQAVQGNSGVTMVESSFLKVFQRHMDVVLRDIV